MDEDGNVDVTTALLDNQGQINDALFMNDHLHLNPKGYDLWNSIIKPLLMKQCKYNLRTCLKTNVNEK